MKKDKRIGGKATYQTKGEVLEVRKNPQRGTKMTTRLDYQLLVKGIKDPMSLEQYLGVLLESSKTIPWDLVHHILDAISTHPKHYLGPRVRSFTLAVLRSTLLCPCEKLSQPQSRITCWKAKEYSRRVLETTSAGIAYSHVEDFMSRLEPCQAARGLARHLGVIDPDEWVFG